MSHVEPTRIWLGVVALSTGSWTGSQETGEHTPIPLEYRLLHLLNEAVDSERAEQHFLLYKR